MATTAAQKASSPHVLIIGSGIGGLTLAQSLRQKGISFQVFERDATGFSRMQGWAIGIHTMLDDLRASVPADMAPLETTCHLKPLKLPAEVAFYKGTQKIGARDDGSNSIIRAHRLRLRRWLTTNLDIQYNKKAVKIEDDDQGVTVFFADGTSATGDILVGAEGGSSPTRNHILKGEDPSQVQPIAAINGETVLAGEVFERQLQLSHSAYITPVDYDGRPGWFFAGLNEVLPGGRAAKYYWMLCWREADAVGPDHWSRTKPLADKHREVGRVLAGKLPIPAMQEVFDHTAPDQILEKGWTFRDLELTALPTGRVTLLGDAAHCMLPFRGEGGTHTMIDALNLGRALAKVDKDDMEQIREVMGVYQEEMLARGAKSVRLSRGAFDSQPVEGAGPREVWGQVARPLSTEKISLDDVIPQDEKERLLA